MGDFKEELSKLQLGDFKIREIPSPGDKPEDPIINQCGRCFRCSRCSERCFCSCSCSCFCFVRCFSCARCGF